MPPAHGWAAPASWEEAREGRVHGAAAPLVAPGVLFPGFRAPDLAPAPLYLPAVP